MASRASSMDVAPCWSRKESKTSWIHRRLPGHLLAGSGEEFGAAWAQRSCSALVPVGELLVPLLHQRLAHAPLRAVPDLTVRVHLGAGAVEAVVGVVERVVVDGVVADRDRLVARGVDADGPRVAPVGVAVAEHVLAGRQVAPRLAHRTALLGRDALVGPADHPVADRVGVLVADDAHVQATVGARCVERAGDRLEEVLVRDAGRAVLERDLVGVVATEVRRLAAGQGAGLGVADLLVAVDATAAQVVELHVVVGLGEAQVVGVVVHPVVGHEEVRDGRVDVRAARGELGRGRSPSCSRRR